MAVLFDFHSTLIIVAAVMNILVTAVVVGKAARTRTATLWILLGSLLSIFLLGEFFIYVSKDPNIVLRRAWVLELGIVFVPPVFLDFVYSLAVQEKRSPTAQHLVQCAYLIGFSLFVIDRTSLVRQVAIPYLNGYRVEAYGAQETTFVFYCLTFIIGMSVLVKEHRQSNGHRRTQYCYIIIAVTGGFLFAMTDFLHSFNFSFPNAAPFGVVFLNVIVAYAILKHQLMDIRIIIRKGFVYSAITAVAVGLFSVLFYGGIFLLERAGLNPLWPGIGSVVLLSLFFDRLKRVIESSADRYLFRADYELRQRVQGFSKIVSASFDVDTLLKQTSDYVQDIMRTRWQFILVPAPGGFVYRVAAYRGIEDSVAQSIELGRDSEIVQRLEHGEPAIACEPGTDTLFHLVVPLKAADRIVAIGVLGEREDGRAYTARDISLMQMLNAQAAIALENARLYSLDITDPLSKVYHRAYFDLRLKQEVDRSYRYKTRLSLVLFDINSFTTYRMAHGPRAADQVLIDIGKLLYESVREFDVPARFGEDEFAIILPDLTQDEAIFVARSVCKKLEPKGLTLSSGVAELRRADDSADALVARAESALYSGRKSTRHLAT